MKVDRKPKAEKSPPAAKTVKKPRRAAPKTNAEHPLGSYEHIPIGIVECSPDARYVNVNEEFCRISGYERQELLTLGIKDITHEDDCMFDINLHERLVAGGIPFYKIEKRIKRKDGSDVWVELTRSVVRGARGKVLYTIGAVLDISDRKDVERVLRESVERLRLATGAAKMFMWEWDLQSQIYTADDNFEKVLGFSGLLPKDTVESVQRLMPAEDRQALNEAVAKAIESHGDLRSLQTRFINPENGDIIWLEINAKIVYDATGNALWMFGVSQNVTDRNKAVEELRVARARAERHADRTVRLQKVTAALSEAVSPAQVAEVIVQQGAAAFGAVSSSLMLLSEDGQALELVYSTTDEVLTRPYKSFPISLKVPVADAVRTNQLVWLESQQEYLERYPHLADQIKLWGQQAALSIPMIYKGRIQGVLTLSFDRILTQTVEDEEYALTLARQGAQALERARAEEALRSSEERMRLAIEANRMVAWEWDPVNDRVITSENVAEIYGMDSVDKAATGFSLIWPDDLPVHQEKVERALREGGEYQSEFRVTRPVDGRVLWMEERATAITNADGQITRLVGVVTDVTERKQAEEKLRESEERFRALVGQATAGIMESDMSGRLTFVNPCFCDTLGYSEVELQGKTIWEITYPEDLAENKRLFELMLSEGISYQLEKRFICRDGSILWASVSMSTIRDAEGEPQGGVGVVIDINERRQAAEALTEFARQQEALYWLSEQLHRTDSLEDVHNAALDAILNALQCDRASILLYDHTDVMHFVAWRGLSDEYRQATDGHSPWTPDTKHPAPIGMDDLRTADLDEALRTIIQGEGIGALAFIPLVSNEKLIGKFMIYYDTPHAFDEAEMDLAMTIAHQLAFGIDRKRTEQALKRERETLQRLFDTMPVIVSMIDPTDYSMRMNAEFERLLGWKNEEVTVVSLLEALYPDPEYRNDALQRMAAAANKNEWVDVQVHTRDGRILDSLWSNVSVFNDDGTLATGIALGLDITERKQTEKRLSLLAEVSEILRNVEDPYELMYAISQAIGEHLNVKRVLFNEIDLEHDREIVHRDYHNGLESVAGAHKISDYSSITSQEVAAGKTVVNVDAKADPRTAQEYEKTYALSGERAYVVIPMMRDNHWVASLWVSDDAPRAWTSEEVSLLETIAERTWTVIEKLRINTALRESEQRFREIFETAGVSVWLEDFTEVKLEIEKLRAQGIDDFRTYFDQHPDFVQRSISQVRILDVNNETLELFEATNKKDLLGSLSNVFAPETGKIFIDELIALAEGRETLRAETQVRTISGKLISVLFTVHFAPLTGDQSHVVVTLTNITERKRIEEALRFENERFMRFVNSNIVGILIADSSGKVTLANDYYLNLLGLTRQDLAEGNVDWRKFTPPEWLPADEKAIRELRETGICEPYEKEYVRADGTRVPVYLADAMLPGPGEEIAAFAIDITERKRAEEALRASEERYRAVVESQSEMLCRFASDGTILFVNEAYARARGATAEQLIQNNFWEFVAEPDRPAVRAMLDSLTPEQPEVQIENRFQTVDGERWTLWTNRALHFDKDRVLLEVQSSGIDITDRKRAEQELRESEERYRFIVENTSDGIWWIDLTEPMPISLSEEEQIDWYYQHAVIRQCNLGLARMYGYNSVEEVTGLPLRAVMPRQNTMNLEMLRKFLRSGYRLVDTETREVGSDGRELVFLNNMIGIVEGGTLKGEWGTNRDITERKRSEAALRESEERYRGIVNQTIAGIAETDLTGKFVMVNDRYCEITGYSRQELLTQEMHMHDLTHPDDLPQNVEQFGRLAADGTSFEIEKRYVRPDGSFAWVHNSVSAIVGPDGKPHSAVAAVIDVTERKRAEETLRRNEELFSTLVESAPFGVYFIDSEFRLRAINKGSEAVFRGIDPLIGRDFAEILRMVWQEPFATEAIEHFRHTLRTGEAFISPPTIEPRANIDEIQSYDWQIHRITMPDGTYGVVCYFYDLSEQKRMEARVRASESLYRAIARNIPGGGVYVVDKDFRYLVAEGPVTEAFGLTREILEGRTVTEAFPDERGQRMEERLRRNFAGETVSFETRFNGRVFWTQQAPLHESLGQAIILTLDITERKQAEEALRQSEERFARFMQHLPGLAWIKDMEGRYVYANAAAESAFRTPLEKLYGSTDEEIFSPEAAAQFRQNDEMALRDEKGIQVVETLEHEDGIRHYSLVSKFPIPGPDGSTALIGGTAFDITERRQAEEALRESERRFRNMADHAPVMVWVTDPTGFCTYLSQSWYEFTGQTPETGLGYGWLDIVHPDDRGRTEKEFLEGIEKHTGFRLEYRLKRRDGVYRWTIDSVQPRFSDSGELLGYIGSVIDITERRQAEEALRESEERFRAILRQATAGIVRKDVEGRLIFVNKAFCNMLGRTEAELIGKTMWDFMHEDDITENKRSYERLMKEGIPFKLERRLLREDGSVIWVDASVSPIMDAEGRPQSAVAVEVDITGRKQAEDALQQLNLQLEERVLNRTAKLREVNQALREEITERRRAEEALRKSEAAARENEEKLSTLFELLPVGISFLNQEGQIIQMNSALTHILKLTKEQLSDQEYTGRTYIRANGTIMPPDEFASQRAFAEGKTAYNVETGIVMEDGDVIWTSVSAAPVAVADVGAVVVTADITESKRAERALQESRERLQVLSQRLVEVQEEERRAIARELHDRVGQTLAALNINLIIISGQLGNKVDGPVSSRLSDSMKLVTETISLVRDVMSDLRPSVLDDYGLEAAIESYLSQFRSRYAIEIKFDKPEEPIPRLGPSIEMTFLRIAQEALMNVAKHAQASLAILSLQCEANIVLLTVQDNGLGIVSWQEANRPGSHGLTIMRERAEAFGGSLQVRSVPGKGTTVEVKIPIEAGDPKQAEERNSQ